MTPPRRASSRPRYASITRSSRWIASGVPSAITWPFVHDDDAVADRHDDVHVVLDDEDCHAASRAQLADVVESCSRQHRRHAGHRLVEQDHARLDHQRPRRARAACAGRRTACRRRRRRGGSERTRLERLERRSRTSRSRRGDARRAQKSGRPAARPAGAGRRASCFPARVMRVSTRGVWNARTSPARAMASPRRRSIRWPANRDRRRDPARRNPEIEIEHRRLPRAVRADRAR